MVKPFYLGWEFTGKEVLQTSTQCREAMQKSTLLLFQYQSRFCLSTHLRGFDFSSSRQELHETQSAFSLPLPSSQRLFTDKRAAECKEIYGPSAHDLFQFFDVPVTSNNVEISRASFSAYLTKWDMFVRTLRASTGFGDGKREKAKLLMT